MGRNKIHYPLDYQCAPYNNTFMRRYIFQKAPTMQSKSWLNFQNYQLTQYWVPFSVTEPRTVESEVEIHIYTQIKDEAEGDHNDHGNNRFWLCQALCGALCRDDPTSFIHHPIMYVSSPLQMRICKLCFWDWSLYFYLCCVAFWNIILDCDSGWPGTYFLVRSSPELTELLLSLTTES